MSNKEKQTFHDDLHNQYNVTDDPVWSILPSYDMHTRVLSRRTDSFEDNLPTYANYSVGSTEGRELPTYTNASSASESQRLSCVSSSRTSSDLSLENRPPNHSNSSINTHLTEPADSDNANFIVTDENTHSWAETITGNIHNLRDLSDASNKFSSAVSMSVHFTKDVGVLHEKPVFIDPSNHEYKKGDFINGHILITNNSDEVIPFDMFYVLFEGTFLVQNPDNKHKPVKYKKFLEMFDFTASYSDVKIDRLISEQSTDLQCSFLEDRVDKTLMGFYERFIYPHRTHKKFFTFKIPDRLLDSECDHHHLSTHTELPPTLGSSDLLADKPGDANTFKDFAFRDSSTTYGLYARFIGKASHYNAVADLQADRNTTLINSQGDEFVIFKQCSRKIRILQQATPMTNVDRKMKDLEINTMHTNLLSRLNEKLDIGNEMLKSINEDKLDTTVELSHRLEQLNKNDLLKARQLYTRRLTYDSRDVKAPSCRSDCDASCQQNLYNVVVPLIKKKLLSPKPSGTLGLEFSKSPVLMKYIPPPKFRRGLQVDSSTWKFDIPVDLKFTPATRTGRTSAPQIKSIRCDLVVLNLKNSKYDIPIELNHNLIFNHKLTQIYPDSVADNDNLHTNIIKPFQKIAGQYYKLFKTLGTQNFRVEQDLVADLKGICDIEEKCMKLEVPDIKVTAVDSANKETAAKSEWYYEDKTNLFHKKLNISVNAESAILKTVYKSLDEKRDLAYDKFCLVPSFQTCNMARLYYFDLTFQMAGNEFFHIKVPARIEKWSS